MLLTAVLGGADALLAAMMGEGLLITRVEVVGWSGDRRLWQYL